MACLRKIADCSDNLFSQARVGKEGKTIDGNELSRESADVCQMAGESEVVWHLD